MTPEKPNIYTAEFRASAVKLANESDKSITQVAKDIGINVNTLHTYSCCLSKSYERLTRTDETWIYIAMARLMLNHLA